MNVWFDTRQLFKNDVFVDTYKYQVNDSPISISWIWKKKNTLIYLYPKHLILILYHNRFYVKCLWVCGNVELNWSYLFYRYSCNTISHFQGIIKFLTVNVHYQKYNKILQKKSYKLRSVICIRNKEKLSENLTKVRVC